MGEIHSITAPSSFSRIVHCAGSIFLSQGVTQPENQSAKDGTGAHWGLERIGTGHLVKKGDKAPNGVFIDEDMLAAIDTCLNYIPREHDQVFWEEKLDLSMVHPSCYGTADIILIDNKNGIIHVVDFKYGFIPVYAFMNWQLILYALGACAKYVTRTDMRVHLHIVQPRAHHVTDEWRTTLSKLTGHYLPIAQAAAAAAMGPNPTATTGDTCHYCPARHRCPAFAHATGTALEVSMQATPMELTPHSAGVELALIDRAQEILKWRRDALEVQAVEIAKGKPITNYHMASTYGRKKWTVNNDQVLAIGRLSGVDLNKPNINTPTEAIKMGIDEAVINNYSKRSPSSLKLLPDGNKLQRIFSKER